MNKPLLTIKEGAAILKVSDARAAQLVREEIIPAVRLGRQVRIDPDQLQAFIAGGGRALPGGWRREVA